MKRLLIAAALAAIGATGAQAADIAARTYTKAPAYAAPAYNWTGIYIGAHVGGAFRDGDNFSVVGTPGGTVTGQRSSFLGGGQLGADYQFAPNWLLGIEGQFSALSDGSRTYTANSSPLDFFTTKTEWLASVTGRLGYTWGAGLIYAKGGIAFRDRNVFVNFGALDAVVSYKEDGFTVGGGLEYMFAPSWSAKIEYQYYDFGNSNVSRPTAVFSVGGANFTENFHTVKAGINYHFNWGGPVVAKY